MARAACLTSRSYLFPLYPALAWRWCGLCAVLFSGVWVLLLACWRSLRPMLSNC